MSTTLDLFALEQSLAEVIATLELEADANDPVLLDSTNDNDKPLAHVSLDQIVAGYGLDMQDRRQFTQRERDARKQHMDKMRKRQKRAMAKRAAMDKQRESKPLDQVRVRSMLNIIGTNLLDVITTTVLARYNRFRRVMGDVSTGDLANDVILAISESLARSDHDIVEIAEAALWLSKQPMPIDTAQDDAPVRARMLMGTIVRKSGHAIVDTYRKSTCTAWVETIGDEGKTEWVKKDVTLTSLEVLETMIRATGGDVDTLLSKHKASGKPKYESKPPTSAHARSFARMVIDMAITARGLDWLTDLMLDSVRTDGAFTWSKHADEVWAGLGMPEVTDMSKAMKVAYTKRAVQMAYAFLPGVISTAYEIASQPEVLAQFTYVSDTNIVTHMSDRTTGGDVQFPPRMEDTLKDISHGKRYVLEGMPDGALPVKIEDGSAPVADESEWKRVFVSSDSSITCSHGARVHLEGMTKKPYKVARRWQGEFCSVKGEGACEPIFHHGEHKVTARQAMNKTDMLIEALSSSYDA